MRRLAGAAVVLVAACLLAPGCRREPAQAPPPASDGLETVDVAPPPDALVDPSRDVQERRRVETFSGVLPSDFPASLPLPTGASLVDQGPGWVEVIVARTPVDLRPRYVAQLQAAGWQAASEGDGALRLSRRGASARARLRADGPSTRLRIDY